MGRQLGQDGGAQERQEEEAIGNISQQPCDFAVAHSLGTLPSRGRQTMAWVPHLAHHKVLSAPQQLGTIQDWGWPGLCPLGQPSAVANTLQVTSVPKKRALGWCAKPRMPQRMPGKLALRELSLAGVGPWGRQGKGRKGGAEGGPAQLLRLLAKNQN